MTTQIHRTYNFVVRSPINFNYMGDLLNLKAGQTVQFNEATGSHVANPANGYANYFMLICIEPPLEQVAEPFYADNTKTDEKIKPTVYDPAIVNDKLEPTEVEVKTEVEPKTETEVKIEAQVKTESTPKTVKK